MTEQTQDTIVIVGGGMTGGLLALLLAQQGLAVTVLDGAPEPQFPQGDAQLRVSTLTEASYHLLCHAGAWQHLDPARLQPYQAMQVWDQDGTGEVNFNAAEVGSDSLGWLVENGHLTAALYRAGEALDNLDWRCQATVEQLQRHGDGWQVHSGGQVFEADLLVGADGARSLVRESAGISAGPRASGHHALVATIATAEPHGGCARQVFMESGPLALLPLFGDGHRCSIVWSGWPALIEELRALPPEAFVARLQGACGEALGAVTLVSERPCFPIEERHASQYVARALALVGDAAHVIHPLAGQGVNLGLLDAGVLAEEVARMRGAGRGCADPQGLARYQRRRRGENLLMQNAMRGFKALFERREMPLRLLRNTGMRWVNGAAPVRRFFIQQALGRGGDLPALARASGRQAPH
ncbi:oxygenase [Alcanivorax hongdengensis A-11-3]|uniref:Oxygenase n=1 Tax=Alcanivorax hongdengensis A-11-3 TaxID=1177179 RepID=L0W831_9GAMM|nr:FAD-dependent monooxygenase [Alcanivorax hongdengensis]EKF73124.1 oxygenase [Alcanivorax hongdengensis A-11-3]